MSENGEEEARVIHSLFSSSSDSERGDGLVGTRRELIHQNKVRTAQRSSAKFYIII